MTLNISPVYDELYPYTVTTQTYSGEPSIHLMHVSLRDKCIRMRDFWTDLHISLDEHTLDILRFSEDRASNICRETLKKAFIESGGLEFLVSHDDRIKTVESVTPYRPGWPLELQIQNR